MAALILQNKGTNTLVNHPNYGDVARTTYAKGVIGDGGDGSTAFQLASTYPFVPTSMVKVEGDWGVSDFIPLLYNQKPGYWNTDGGFDKA